MFIIKVNIWKKTQKSIQIVCNTFAPIISVLFKERQISSVVSKIGNNFSSLTDFTHHRFQFFRVKLLVQFNLIIIKLSFGIILKILLLLQH